MNRRSPRNMAKRIFCVALSLVLVLSVSGCKPTDFFVEKIITPNAEQVDEKNPDALFVNDPDSTETSDSLSALDWSDHSYETEEVQNLVVYSETPTTTMTTHHSVFDIAPAFPEIRASDGVKAVFASTSTVQSDVDSDEQTDQDVSSRGNGESDKEAENVTDANAVNSDKQAVGMSMLGGRSSGNGDSQGDGDDSDQGNGDGSNPGDTDGGSNTGNGGTGDDGDGGSGDEGEGDGDGGGGQGGTIKIVDPNDATVDLPKANRVAVIGKQVATMVEAFGQGNAICAMSARDYYNKDTNAADAFGDVFGGMLTDTYFWGDQNASTAEEALESLDIDSLVNAFADSNDDEKKAVIVYDPSEIDGDKLQSIISGKMEKATTKRDVYMVPISMAGTNGVNIVSTLTNSVEGVRKVLNESTKIDADKFNDRAKGYKNLLEALSNAATSNGNNKTSVCIATDSEFNVTVRSDSSSNMLSNQAVLFDNYRQSRYTPLDVWTRAAGFATRNAADKSNYASKGTRMFLVPDGRSSYVAEHPTYTLTSSSLYGIVTKWGEGDRLNDGMFDGKDGTTTVDNAGGLGSEYFPYLVVCSNSEGREAKEVETAIENSILSSSRGSTPDLYAAFGDGASLSDFVLSSSNMGRNSGDGNKMRTEANVKGTVVANPDGILGSWTESTFESVLEAVWLNALYQKSPFDGSAYSASESDSLMNAVANAIDADYSGSTPMEKARSLISAFYSIYYGGSYTPDYGED